jgi:hypothetical protein
MFCDEVYVMDVRNLFLFFGLTLPFFCFAQNSGEASFGGVVPEILRRPSREKELVYPVDAVIGQLSGGDAPAGANAYARGLLRDLMRRNEKADTLKDISPALLTEAMTKIGETEPRKARLGSGREEIDGSVSFLFRFMGRENELAGELYIRLEEEKWKTEDIIFNDPKKLSRASEEFRPVYTPYERFY